MYLSRFVSSLQDSTLFYYYPGLRYAPTWAVTFRPFRLNYKRDL